MTAKEHREKFCSNGLHVLTKETNWWTLVNGIRIDKAGSHCMHCAYQESRELEKEAA